MSKKRRTKKQKIAAGLRNEMASQSRTGVVYARKEKSCQWGDLGASLNPQEQKPKMERADIADYFSGNAYVRRQLFKTIMISLIVLSLELVLYFKLN